MKVFISDTYENLSKQVADDLVLLLKNKKQVLLCVASGDSPSGLYRELVKRVQQEKLDVSGWYFVGLDEWLGMNWQDEGSCRFHLDQQLFQPLQINEDRIGFFDGRTIDAAAECRRIEAFIAEHGGIDVAILGLGMNGHIGMNEPGTPASTFAHVAALDEETKRVGQKYFKEPKQLSGGLTLGIADLQEARKVVIVANGRHKASIVERMLNEPVSDQLPVSHLRHNPDLAIYLDQEAAGKIK